MKTVEVPIEPLKGVRAFEMAWDDFTSMQHRSDR
jgi:hypothetical protein